MLRKQSLWLSLVALLVALPNAGLAGHPMTFEDMVQIRTPAAIALSRAGGRMAHVVSGRVLEENSGYSQLFVRDLADGKDHRVTAGGEHEGSPAFSPDGKWLAFTSDAGGKGQIWLKECGTEKPPEQVTALATGAGAPRFSADGRTLYFTSRVYPHCLDPECNRMNQEEESADPVQAGVFDRLMYRHWDHWRDGRVAHVHQVDLATLESRDLMAGDGWGVTGAWDVSADGKSVVYTTKNPKNETLTTNNDLYMFDLKTARAGTSKPIQVTTNEAYDDQPVLSPNGRSVAYHSHRRARFESDLLVLTVKDLDGGDPVRFAEALDRPTYEYGWFPDGKALWLAVADAGRMTVYKVKRSGGEPEKLVTGHFLTDLVLSPDGSKLYCVRHSLSAGPEIWAFALADGSHEKLTAYNDELFQGLDLATVEDFWWTGADGDPVHGFLLFPPGTSKEQKNPFLLLIHGGPQGMWSDRLHPRWNAQLFAAPGYVTLLANPRGSVGYGQRFTDQISRDWGGRCYEDLMASVAALKEKGWIDDQRMCAGGGSFGGYMANWILAKNNRFQCLFSHAGVYDIKSKYGSTDELWFPEWEFGGPPWKSADYEKFSPSNYVENFETPMLVIHGQHDYRVAVNQAMQLFTALQRRGIPSKFLYYPDETHFVVKPKNSLLWYDTIHDWLARWLGN